MHSTKFSKARDSGGGGGKVVKFRRPAQEVQAFSEIGYSGLNHWSGDIKEEFLKDLQGKRGIKIYKEMRDNDPILGAVLFAVQMLIRQASWKVVPFDETNEHIKRAKFIESCMTDMSMTWADVMSEILTMLPFGWSWLEVCYKRRAGYTGADDGGSSRFKDGLIGWRKMPLRSQDSLQKWELDDRGGIHAMHQLTPDGKQKKINISKSLLFRTEANKNNPEGRSILRNCYRPWYFKKRIEEIEAIGIERDLAGLPKLMPPQGVDIWNKNNPLAQQMRQEAETIVRNIRRDEQEGLLLPFGWEFELVSTGGTRSFNTNDVISRYNNAMAMTCLADFIILGHNNRYGSKALAGNKTQMFQMSVVGWLDAIQEVFNRYELPRLYSLNKWDPGEVAKLEHGDIALPNLAELGTYIKDLVGAGFQLFPNVPIERHLVRTASLPTEGVEFGRKPPEPKPLGGDPNASNDKKPKASGSNSDGDRGGTSKAKIRIKRKRRYQGC